MHDCQIWSWVQLRMSQEQLPAKPSFTSSQARCPRTAPSSVELYMGPVCSNLTRSVNKAPPAPHTTHLDTRVQSDGTTAVPPLLQLAHHFGAQGKPPQVSMLQHMHRGLQPAAQRGTAWHQPFPNRAGQRVVVTQAKAGRVAAAGGSKTQAESCINDPEACTAALPSSPAHLSSWTGPQGAPWSDRRKYSSVLCS